MVSEEDLDSHTDAETTDSTSSYKPPKLHQNTDTTTTNTTKTTKTTMPPLNIPPNLTFGPFKVPSQIFHISATRLSYGLVNLKPLLPGHTLICPVRRVPRLSQLSIAETTDLFLTVRRVSRTLERVYAADAFNVAVQDGVEAGQSVPHVHVHVIPRRKADMDAKGGGDALYEMMEGEEGDLGAEMVEMLRRRRVRDDGGRDFVGDEERGVRGEEEMRREAEWLRSEMERDEREGGEDL